MNRLFTGSDYHHICDQDIEDMKILQGLRISIDRSKLQNLVVCNEDNLMKMPADFEPDNKSLLSRVHHFGQGVLNPYYKFRMIERVATYLYRLNKE